MVHERCFMSLALLKFFSAFLFFLGVDHFKSLYLICYSITCFMFWFFWSQGTWGLSSPTGDWTHTPCIGRQSLNHWATREVPTLHCCPWFTLFTQQVFIECLLYTRHWTWHLATETDRMRMRQRQTEWDRQGTFLHNDYFSSGRIQVTNR